MSRHFVDVAEGAGTRRVHYRVAGSGPPLLLVHQSPRSGAEWLPLMERWGGEFTLIAPDTPGFGDSTPLANARPEVADYADAIVAFLDAVGLEDVAAHGFHSGAILLVTAAKRHPARFRAVSAGGYAVWTAAERADFGERYTPDFLPTAYGEHLAWLWLRVLEQSWFFPWYRAADSARLPGAHDEVGRVHEVVMDVLPAGNSFSLGYAAVLRAERDLPAAGEAAPPVLIVGYAGDPLTAHIDRLGPLPEGWAARKVETPAEAEAMALEWLRPHAGPVQALGGGAADEGFVQVAAAGFDGLLHWQGAGELRLHAPGRAAGGEGLALDLPGHGLSDDWPDAPVLLDAWTAVVVAAVRALGARVPRVHGDGWGAVLAERVAAELGTEAGGAVPRGDRGEWAATGLPDLTPDRFGAYLHRAWQVARASVFFEPWFAPGPANARAFGQEEVAPARLAVAHLALLRARRGREYLRACLGDG